MKFEQYENIDYVKMYKSDNHKYGLYLGKHINKYYINFICYDKNRGGEVLILLKDNLERNDGLKALAKIKKAFENGWLLE